MSTISASTTSTTAYKVTADTTGALVLQTGATPTTALTIDASQNITTANKFAKASMPTGSVLQVVQFTTNTETNSTTSTYIDTAITMSITPTSATSKILALVSVNGLAKLSTNTTGNLRLLRGASSLMVFGGAFGYTASSAANAVAGASLAYLDSPATTSATTYKVQVVNAGNSGEIRVNWDNNAYSSITLMEIAA
jgi:hypothetical protein